MNSNLWHFWRFWPIERTCRLSLLLAGGLVLSFPAQVQAQPDVPFVPSQATARAIADTVAALVEATGSDEGYETARKLTVGASSDEPLGNAWREWRRVALVAGGASDAVPLDAVDGAGDSGQVERNPANLRLVLRGVEVEDEFPGRGEGTMQARVKVHLDVASVVPGQPVDAWPADPWQGEFLLQKSGAQGVPWQFVFAPPENVPAGFLSLSERGGNSLQQAVQVLCQPQAMEVTARFLAQGKSLHLLGDAIDRYAARTGHYPPAFYSQALLDAEPQASRPALRRSLAVPGTPRSWVLNPALAGKAAFPTPKTSTGRGVPEARGALRKVDASSFVPLLWDGTASRPEFSLAGHALLAFADGRIELQAAPTPKEATLALR